MITYHAVRVGAEYRQPTYHVTERRRKKCVLWSCQQTTSEQTTVTMYDDVPPEASTRNRSGPLRESFICVASSLVACNCPVIFTIRHLSPNCLDDVGRRRRSRFRRVFFWRYQQSESFCFRSQEGSRLFKAWVLNFAVYWLMRASTILIPNNSRVDFIIFWCLIWSATKQHDDCWTV